MNNLILILLEKVCEAIYFALFMIYGKNLKEKRLLFIGIMVVEYLMITEIFMFNIWIHILYIAVTYINLKVLYKEKTQITDIFLFMAASIYLIIISFLCYGVTYLICNKNVTYLGYMLAIILNRIILFATIIGFKNKINKFYNNFYKHWNKSQINSTKTIRSLTLRNISIIIFNLMFCIINLGMAFAIAIFK